MQQITAVVLAGGRGARLRPLTDGLPKPLLRVAGKAIIEHVLENLVVNGIRDIIICTGYQAEKVERFMSYSAGVKIRFSNAGEEAAMTTRLLSLPEVRERVLVCYGDEIANVNLKRLTRAHEFQKKPLTVTIMPFRSDFGLFEFAKTKDFFATDGERRRVRFSEKPIIKNHWINIGYVLMEREVLKRIWKGESMADVLWAAADAECLGFYRHRGMRVTINTEHDLMMAEKELAR